MIGLLYQVTNRIALYVANNIQLPYLDVRYVSMSVTTRVVGSIRLISFRPQ